VTATVDRAPVTFLGRAERDLRDDRLRAAVRNATDLMAGGRLHALAGLEDPDGLRDAARTLRAGVMAELPELLDVWSTRFEARGGHVHWAADAAEATAMVRDLVRHRQARTVAKGKSMASEEIHLNDVLEADGVEVVETDLGEFIIQLAGETPSHIIAPAIHHDRYTVADLFAADGGHPVDADIGAEAAYAQVRLRESFLSAGIGISGVNFAVAETGSICLVENEGNGRMCTSVPEVHIAIMGMERTVRDWSELDVMLGLLARSATRAGPVRLHEHHHRAPASGRRRRPPRGARRGAGQRPLPDPGQRVPGGPALHPLRRLPQRVPRLPAGGWPRVRVGVRGADRRGADTAAAPGGSGGAGAGRGVDAVRCLLGGLPGPHPVHDLLLQLRQRDAGTDAGRARRLGFAGWSWLWSTRAGFAASTQLGRLGRRLARGRTRLPGWAGKWVEGRELP
jgi:hypothetical protein